MDIFIVDLGFISWWHLKLMNFAINWRAGWPTSMEYGEVSLIDLTRPFDPWKVIESVRDVYMGPIVREHPPYWSSG